MTSHERVLAACAFRRPDRIPRFDTFWAFPDAWRRRLGDPEDLTDIAIWCPDETVLPSRARPLREEGGYIYEVDSWGRTVRRRIDAYFIETLAAAVPDRARLATLRFDPPELDARYCTGKAEPSVTYPTQADMEAALRADKQRHCVFGKTGGPYLRSTYLRGEPEFLMDLAGDTGFARAVVDKVTDHLIAVGREQLRRWDLCETGLWIYDDMACNRGPMFSPAKFEEIFLPAYRRMVRAYKEAGARYVFLHSDGDIGSLLDMLVDAGIDGINPLERRANMDIACIRRRYPKLILVGGMCNTRTLVGGTPAQVAAEARAIIDLGRDGGVVIGTHSVSPETPLENFVAYHEACQRYGNFAGPPAPHIRVREPSRTASTPGN